MGPPLAWEGGDPLRLRVQPARAGWGWGVASALFAGARARRGAFSDSAGALFGPSAAGRRLARFPGGGAESLYEWPGQNGAPRPSGARLGTLFSGARIRLARATFFFRDASVCCTCTLTFSSPLRCFANLFFFFFGPREALTVHGAPLREPSRTFRTHLYFYFYFHLQYFFGLDRVQKQKNPRGKMLLFFWGGKNKNKHAIVRSK